MNRFNHPGTTTERDAPVAVIWLDIARLAAEALAIGVAFSVLLALAVLVVARGAGNGDAFRAETPPADVRTI